MDVADPSNSVHIITRVRIMYALLLVVFSVFVVRLFYLQVIKHDTYVNAARSDQIHEYELDANRGTIYAQMGDTTVPLVVNQKLYTIYADPGTIKDANTAVSELAPLLGKNETDVKALLTLKGSRYVILGKQVSPELKNRIIALKLPGIGSQERNYRSYPQGTTAAQLLGFVNDGGEGKYGIEQALNSELAGKNGQLKAVTDVNGIPLAANESNISQQPVAGKDVTLTIDLGMQTQVEQILKRYQEQFGSEKISAVVLETNTGAVKAMANYPSYDPAKYNQVQDAALFQNATVSEPIEPGSIGKILTIAAALNTGAITPDTSYNDPGVWTFDGAKVVNVAEGTGSGPQTIKSLLNLSLNTGAVWVLTQMGGGTLNDKARQTLYDYFTKHYRVGQATGIEQGYEGVGYLTEPQDKDNGITITYANMAFGQAYSVTATQMSSIMSAIINGGTYYQPHLVASTTGPNGTTTVAPKALVSNVVSSKTSQEMVDLLDYVVKAHDLPGWSYMRFSDRYSVGGKTGTAQMTNDSGGGYRNDVFNGSYLGFVGGDKPQYTIIIYNFKPRHYSGYAGASTGQPIFADIAHMLIDNYGVTPKTK